MKQLNDLRKNITIEQQYKAVKILVSAANPTSGGRFFLRIRILHIKRIIGRNCRIGYKVDGFD
jgi:hypothetical protein